MSQNALQICNAALIKLGLSPISSLDEKTVMADVIRARYAACRDYLLTSHVWHFAIKSVVMTPEVDADAADWTHAAPLPADHGRTLHIVDSRGDNIAFERIGNHICYADQNPRLFYVRNFGSIMDDKFSFPPQFSEALSCYLGADVAMALTKDLNLRQTLFQQFADTLSLARHHGAVDTYTGTETELWVEQRNAQVPTPSNRPFTIPAIDETWGGLE